MHKWATVHCRLLDVPALGSVTDANVQVGVVSILVITADLEQNVLKAFVIDSCDVIDIVLGLYTSCTNLASNTPSPWRGGESVDGGRRSWISIAASLAPAPGPSSAGGSAFQRCEARFRVPIPVRELVGKIRP
jgi:hypothetical protein